MAVRRRQLHVAVALLRWAVETIHAAKIGKQLQVDSDDNEGGDTAQNSRAHQPKPTGRHARFELPELVGSAYEHRAHGTDAASDGVWCFELYEQVPDVDTDHVTCTEQNQRDQRDRNDFESPKTIVAAPNSATPPNIHLPT